MRLRTFLQKNWRVPAPSRQNQALRQGIALLARAGEPKLGPKIAGLRVEEQPFDAHLLSLSALYARARSLFFESGGSFRPSMVSSPRSLGSPTLLEARVDYSPVESEYFWSVLDPIEKRNSRHVLGVRAFVTSLFHEQNHRTLWSVMPPAPREPKDLKRYLNFAESLVIALDMALGDELGPRIANLFYLTGTTYDPGSTVRQEIGSRRAYKNYLHAAAFAVYLNLELYDPKQVGRALAALFPGLGEYSVRAAGRGGNLDLAFIWKTNPTWQRKHLPAVAEALCKKGNPGLRLPDNPLDNREYYLFAERWFGAFGL
ncbi:MAG: hypothetical protein P4M08_01865 [Oligoflexia bacterium]|nr:hypothetical protein [Oligoflexia bacterium]